MRGRIRLQSVISGESEIYIRGKTGESPEDVLLIPAGEKISTDTYMNLFDAGFWYEHTGCENFGLSMKLCGSGEVNLMRHAGENTEKIETGEFSFGETTEIFFELPVVKSEKSGYYFFEIKAAENTELSEGYYFCSKV